MRSSTHGYGPVASASADAADARLPVAAYVKALGGKLKIFADFGDESYFLG
ncbi:hypothetical protein [Streptomyces sp. ME18-1-4]|uniref:hypothetical protein n=1 Tax=Streptomyces sp. ME18-1-4 TaxID=3028685 RepID=UPI0029B078E9|nr:hypothetical protein [Streptomyces sp. ME18-1-4]MDX3241786.1 hypothetical protein [Streptomyces sp. ME18-1-4]